MKEKIINLNKKQKISLAIGIIVLVVFLYSAIGDAIFRVNEFNKQLKLIDQNTLTELLKYEQLRPTLLGFMWKKTLTFTYITNLSLAVSLIIYSFYGDKLFSKLWLFYSSTWITITFIVFWSLIFAELAKAEFWQLSFTISTHAINPIIGMIMLFYFKKDLSKYIKFKHCVHSVWFMIVYYIFALVIFFSGYSAVRVLESKIADMTINVYKVIDLPIYSFLNFARPLFYSGNSIVLKILLNVIIVIVGILTVIGLSTMWMKLIRIRKNKKVRRDIK